MIIAGGQIFKIAATRFVDVSKEEINLMKENTIPRNTKQPTKFGMTLFKGKMWVSKEIFVKICWQLKTPTPTWKCPRCIMQISYLYSSDFPLKNFCKLAQHAEAIRKKNCLGKEQWRVFVVDKSIDHDKPHFHLFLTTWYERQRKCFFSERELKKALRDTLTRVACMNINQQWQVSVKFNIPLFRYFYNHLTNYTKAIIRLGLVNI